MQSDAAFRVCMRIYAYVSFYLFTRAVLCLCVVYVDAHAHAKSPAAYIWYIRNIYTV